MFMETNFFSDAPKITKEMGSDPKSGKGAGPRR
jgi:hypothetical protein